MELNRKDYVSRQNVIEKLTDKDDKKAYGYAKDIAAKSAVTNQYYELFDDFIELLNDKNSYVRTRGFCLACAQARWDKDGKLEESFDKWSRLLNDEKPTVVRQCLAALHEVILYRPELCGIIKEAVMGIEIDRYKDSVSPLIKKDAKELLSIME